MNIYVIFLIFLMLIFIFTAIIIDRIDKKKRNGIQDKNKITDGELDFIEKKREIMEEFQRISTQTIGFR